MADQQPHDIILDHLRAIRTDVAFIKEGQDALKVDVLGVRRQLHDLRGELLRQEESIATLAVQVDRINTRLGLNDPQQ